MILQELSEQKVELFAADSLCILSYTLTYEGKRRTSAALAIKGTQLRAEFPGIAVIEDSFTLAGDLIILKRKWHIMQRGSYRLQAAFSYQDGEKENSLFIPAVWYQDNLKGKGCFPSPERSTSWSFLETRMAIPCCAQLSNGQQLFSCATEPAQEERFLSSVAAERHGIIISIPGSEWPYSYRGKQSLVDTSQDSLPTLEVGAEGLVYERTFYLANQKTSDSQGGYCSFVAALPEPDRKKSPRMPAWQDWFEYKLTRLINLVKKTENDLAYLAMGEGNDEVQDVYAFTAASFLVKSLQGAYELANLSSYQPKLACLKQARKNLACTFGLQDDGLLLAQVAKRIADFFLQAEISEGVFQDNYDLNNHIWGGYLGIGEHPEFRS
ncbi:MAG: hypothetical protein EOM32_04725, partial [Spirochaetia bacterium]|nr:hypothetical protein [Spirochaetia bacterium]